MLVLVKKFKKFLLKSINNISRGIKKRSRKILFKDIIYCSLLLIGNNQSYDEVNANLKINNILNVSKNALVKYKNNINYRLFDELNNRLLDYIYNNNNKRVFAVDSTIITLFKSLEKDSFSVSRNGNYCTAMISTLFDIDMEMPINYNLVLHKSERDALIEQFKYLKKNDILIMDRGYYSKKLIFKINKIGVDVIVRLKSNLKCVSLLDNNDKTIKIRYHGKVIKFRLIKFLINDQIYYIGTTIYDKPINYFKNMYWKRWKIEINFKYSKYNLSMNNIKSKTKNAIMQDISIHNLIFIIESYFRCNLKFSIKDNYKINTSLLLNVILNNILYLLFYKNGTKKNISEILRILNIVQRKLIYVKPNRHYERIRKKPTSKWCQYGNKYKLNH